MRSQGGFTLLELLVAVAVAAVVLATVYGVYGSVSRARDRVERRGAAAHQARVLFDRLGRELRGAYPAGGEALPFAGGTDRGSGRTFLRFATTASTPEGGSRGGIRTLRYELLPGSTPGAPGELKRSEAPAFLGEPPPERAYRMLAGVSAWQLRFHNGTDWQSDWPPVKERQPVAVEMTLTLQAEGEQMSFVSALELPAVVPLQ